MATQIIVSDDAKFNAWADMNTPYFAMDRDASISGLSGLSAAMASFDQPQPTPRELTDLRYAQQPNPGYADYLVQQGQGLAGYWSQPMKAPDVLAAPVAALDAVTDLFSAPTVEASGARGAGIADLGQLGTAFGAIASKPIDPVDAYAARRRPQHGLT